MSTNSPFGHPRFGYKRIIPTILLLLALAACASNPPQATQTLPPAEAEATANALATIAYRPMPDEDRRKEGLKGPISDCAELTNPEKPGIVLKVCFLFCTTVDGKPGHEVVTMEQIKPEQRDLAEMLTGECIAQTAPTPSALPQQLPIPTP